MFGWENVEVSLLLTKEKVAVGRMRWIWEKLFWININLKI
jgi:hypothetical protein